MAKLSIAGMDEVAREMARMGQRTGPVADEMLTAGGAEMVKAWKKDIQMFGHVDTGAMLKAVKPTKIKTVDGDRSMDVYPLGNDKTGQKKPRRNAEKAFVLHYGRSNMPGSHFVDKVAVDGEPEANKAMEARWDEFIEKGS